MANIFKKLANVLYAAKGIPTPKNFTSALIVAAGNSTRMEGKCESKQMEKLCGTPTIVHTMLAYEKADCIDEIIVAAKEDELHIYDTLASIYSISKFKCAVKGGKDRSESVMNAFAKINKKSKFVAIADGVRPLITPEDIDKVCHSAYSYGAATAAVRSRDSVKIADKNRFILSSPERATVWLAQTPQVFGVKLYRTAAYYAEEKELSVTDDNMLIEAIRHPVKLVETSETNIKLTYPEDITIAEAIIKERKTAGENKK